MNVCSKNNYMIESAYGSFYPTNSPDDCQSELCSYNLDNIIWRCFETFEEALIECYIITGGDLSNEFQKYISYSKNDNIFYVEILLDEHANHITETDRLYKKWENAEKQLNSSIGGFEIYKKDNTLISINEIKAEGIKIVK